MSYPGRSPRCFGRLKLGVWKRALNIVEKSAEGIVGTVKALSHESPIRRPERCPERGLKERGNRLPRKTAIASGESRGRKPAGWGESGIGAARNDAPVNACVATEPLRHNGLMRINLICRTAVYVTRSYGGVGGGSREAFPYPD